MLMWDTERQRVVDVKGGTSSAATTTPREDEMSKITTEEAALVRKVLATTGYAAPMHERQEARRIVDRFLPPMPYTGRGRGYPMAFGDASNC